MMEVPTQQKAEKAQAMVEFALTVPILLFLMLGIIDLARVLYGYNQVVDATRQAVRYGIVDGMQAGQHQYLNCAGIRNAATKLPGLLRIQSSDITIKYEDSKGTATLGECTTSGPSIWTVNNGEVLAVTIQGSVRPLTPILAMFSNSISFSYTSRRTIQGEGAPYTSNWPTPPKKPSSFNASVICTGGSDTTNVSFTYTWDGGTPPQRAQIRNSLTGAVVRELTAAEMSAGSCAGCSGIPRDNGFGMYYLVAVNGSAPSEMAGPPSEIKTVYCDPITMSGTTIRGWVFNDKKNNGTVGVKEGGEAGIPGVLVILTDPGTDGRFDNPDDVVTAGPDGYLGTADDVVGPGPDGVIDNYDDTYRMAMTIDANGNNGGMFTITGLSIPTGTTRRYKINVSSVVSYGTTYYPTASTSTEIITNALAPNTTYNTATNPYLYMGWDATP